MIAMQDSSSSADRFQFLIGTIQTDEEKRLQRKAAIEFQFLIGTIQTSLATRETALGDQVSIPHRYDTNEAAAAILTKRYLFQFLIGTIQTHPSRLGPGLHPQFQFLIGTIQTRNSVQIPRPQNTWFQFLIGTIQTGRA